MDGVIGMHDDLCHCIDLYPIRWLVLPLAGIVLFCLAPLMTSGRTPRRQIICPEGGVRKSEVNDLLATARLWR